MQINMHFYAAATAGLGWKQQTKSSVLVIFH